MVNLSGVNVFIWLKQFIYEDCSVYSFARICCSCLAVFAYYPYIYPGSAAFMYHMAGFQAPSVSSSAPLSVLLQLSSLTWPLGFSGRLLHCCCSTLVYHGFTPSWHLICSHKTAHEYEHFCCAEFFITLSLLNSHLRYLAW